MSKTAVRLIIKETIQPPIDTPAQIKHHTIVVEDSELYEMLSDQEKEYSDRKHKHSTFQVIGSELAE